MIFEQKTAEQVRTTSGNVPARRTLIRFGIFELDAEGRELRKQGVRIRLQEQPFQILQVLSAVETQVAAYERQSD